MAELNRSDAERIIKQAMPGWKVVDVPAPTAADTADLELHADAESPDLFALAHRRGHAARPQPAPAAEAQPAPAPPNAAATTRPAGEPGGSTIVIVEPEHKPALDSDNPAYAAKRVVIDATGRIKGTQG